MTGLIHAEVRKYTSTRLAIGMALAMVGFGALFSGLFGWFLSTGSFVPGGPPTADIVSPLTLARLVYTSGIQIGYLLTLTIGVLCIGSEFRHKTVTSTFLATPRRGRVIAAKVVALTMIAVANAVLFLAGCLLAGGIVLAGQDRAVFPEPAQLVRTLALVLLVLALWALIGLGIGILIPNQVAALLVAIGFAWIVEPLTSFLLTLVDGGDRFARFFPSQASSATLDLFTGVDDQLLQALGGAENPLSWWVAALVLLLYAALMTLIGLVLTRRRDIA